MLRLICICPEMWGEFFLENVFQGIIPFILRLGLKNVPGSPSIHRSLAHVFFYEFSKIFKSTCLVKHRRTAGSEN